MVLRWKFKWLISLRRESDNKSDLTSNLIWEEDQKSPVVIRSGLLWMWSNRCSWFLIICYTVIVQLRFNYGDFEQRKRLAVRALVFEVWWCKRSSVRCKVVFRFLFCSTNATESFIMRSKNLTCDVTKMDNPYEVIFYREKRKVLRFPFS